MKHRDITLRAKLALGYGLAVIALIATGTVAYYQLTRIEHTTRVVTDYVTPLEDAVSQVEMNLFGQISSLSAYLRVPTADLRAQFETSSQTLQEQVDEITRLTAAHASDSVATLLHEPVAHLRTSGQSVLDVQSQVRSQHAHIEDVLGNLNTLLKDEVQPYALSIAQTRSTFHEATSELAILSYSFQTTLHQYLTAHIDTNPQAVNDALATIEAWGQTFVNAASTEQETQWAESIVLATEEVVRSTARLGVLAKQCQDLFHTYLAHVTETKVILSTDVHAYVTAHSTRAAEAATGVVQSSRFILLGLILIGILAAGLTGFSITTKLSRDVRQLDEAATRVAKGDLDIQLSIRSNDEMGTLARSNETMIRTIKTLIAEVRRLTQHAAQGELHARGNADAFTGAFAEVVDGFNETLDLIVNPVEEATQVIRQMAVGDLTSHMEAASEGDWVVLKDALNHTITTMRTILTEVDVTVYEVHSGAQQVAAASQSLSNSASDQAISLQETASAMAEIGQQTRSSAEHASRANLLALQFQAASERGNSEMEHLVQAMREIDQSSQDISRIIKVIDEIAFQTNLLALNAAVEAARAGRHGKGFAVVAEEVRNLAARSAQAAKETATLIEGAVTKAENGSQMAQRTTEALQEIALGSSQVAEIMDDIATSSNEQAIAVSQVNQALAQIEGVTQRNTASSVQSAAAAAQLTGRAEQLSQILDRFKLTKAAVHPLTPFSSGDGALPEMLLKNVG